MKILQEKCERKAADDKTLPYSAYLVEYEVDNEVCYDIVLGDKQSDIFDHYYDKYKKGFKSFIQAEGRVSPRQWNDPTVATPPKKVKKRKLPKEEEQ